MNNFRNSVNQYTYLTEGIRFFKNSKKMYKLANKIQQVEEGKHELSERILDIAIKMESIEKSFSIATKIDKDKIRQKYRALSVKYSELINHINNEETLRYLKNIGALSSVLLATLGGYYYIATNGDLVMNTFADETEKKFGIRPSEEALKSVKAQIEKDGPVDYIKGLKNTGKGMINAGSGKWTEGLLTQSGSTLISAGENLGALARITAAVSGGTMLGTLGIVKLFRTLLGFKKAKRLAFYSKTATLLDKIEKLD